MNINDVIAEVRKLADENPNFVYPSAAQCYYAAQEGVPACIVGQALSRLGVPEERLGEADKGALVGGINAAVLVTQLGLSDNQFSLESGWLLKVQQEQDQQKNWLGAVDSADRLYLSDTGQ